MQQNDSLANCYPSRLVIDRRVPASPGGGLALDKKLHARGVVRQAGGVVCGLLICTRTSGPVPSVKRRVNVP